MGAAEFGGCRWVSRAAIVSLVWVLVTATMSADASGTGPVTVNGGAISATTAGVDVPFSCPAGAMTLIVTGAVQPSPAADGALVDLTLALSVSLPTSIPEDAEIRIGQPLPVGVASVAAVDIRDAAGAPGGTWTASEGTLTLVLPPVGPDRPSAELATVVATLRLASGIAPAVITVTSPDHLAVGPVPDGLTGPPPCTPDRSASPVVTLDVVDPAPGGSPPPADPPSPDVEAPSTTPPDPASGGDAPTPPPLTEEETPVVPPAADPGAASQVVTGDVDGARSRLDAAVDRLAALDDRVEALDGRSGRLGVAERELEAERDRLAATIARVRGEMGRCAADAYEEAVEAGTDFRNPGTGAALMRVLLGDAVAEYERLLARQADVLAELGGAASDRAVRQPSLDEVEAERSALAAQVSDRTSELNTFLGGGEMAVSGFRFPVGDGHSFSDTWQAPRAGDRRHQGTDIFADEGTPLRAAERGALARVGTDVLGGNKLWVVGESGTHYYYAHLSGYAADVADEVVVEAGQVIGYVGNTGDARTTPPHLHFEVHPGGGSAVNGYPMLVAADTGAPAPVVPPAEPVDPPTPTDAASSADDPAPDASAAAAGPEPAGPRAVALDRSGNVYVADTTNDRVQRFDPDGALLGKWGETGSDEGQFRRPAGVAVGPDGSVYVADSHNNRVQRFTAAGRFVTAWGRTGDRPGQFNHPADVAVNGDGEVFVIDRYNNRVQVFDADGEHLDSWGTFGADEGDLAHPEGVAVDARGDVFVADTFNGRVQRFTASGRFLAVFASGASAEGASPRPDDVVVDETGTAWVTDQVDEPVREYDKDGVFVRAWTRTELVEAQDELPPALPPEVSALVPG